MVGHRINFVELFTLILILVIMGAICFHDFFYSSSPENFIVQYKADFEVFGVREFWVYFGDGEWIKVSRGDFDNLEFGEKFLKNFLRGE